jgi:hypothetical protein
MHTHKKGHAKCGMTVKMNHLCRIYLDQYPRVGNANFNTKLQNNNISHLMFYVFILNKPNLFYFQKYSTF